MRLKEIREEFDFTQKYVASKLSVKQNTYSQYESGKRQLPLESLILLSALFSTSTDYILGLTDESAPYPARDKF